MPARRELIVQQSGLLLGPPTLRQRAAGVSAWPDCGAGGPPPSGAEYLRMAEADRAVDAGPAPSNSRDGAFLNAIYPENFGPRTPEVMMPRQVHPAEVLDYRTLSTHGR
jgi:hypothetical protein